MAVEDGRRTGQIVSSGEQLMRRVQLSCHNRLAAFGVYDREREFPLLHGHTLRLQSFHHTPHDRALLEEQSIVPPVVSVTEIVKRGEVEIHYVLSYRENNALDYKKLVYRGVRDSKKLIATQDLGEPQSVEEIIAKIQTREEQEALITPPRLAA